MNSIWIPIGLSIIVLAIVIILGRKKKPANNQTSSNHEATADEGSGSGFTATLDSEHIMFRVSEGTHIETIIDIAGHKLDNNGDIVPGQNPRGPLDRFIRYWLGRYWIGIPLLRQKHRWNMVKSRENPATNSKTPPEKWVLRDEPIQVSELRWKFPRAVLAPDVELLGNTQSNIRVLANFRVKNPFRAVFTQNGRFLELIESYLQTAVIEYCKLFDYDALNASDKGFTGPFSVFVINSINQILIDEIGIEITGASITRFDTSTQETQELMEKKKRAEIEGDAEIIKAQKALDKARIEAETEEIRAKASVADITGLVKDLIETHQVSPDIAAQTAMQIGRASRVRQMGQLTTYVDGGGSNVSIPTR